MEEIKNTIKNTKTEELGEFGQKKNEIMLDLSNRFSKKESVEKNGIEPEIKNDEKTLKKIKDIIGFFLLSGERAGNMALNDLIKKGFINKGAADEIKKVVLEQKNKMLRTDKPKENPFNHKITKKRTIGKQYLIEKIEKQKRDITENLHESKNVQGIFMQMEKNGMKSREINRKGFEQQEEKKYQEAIASGKTYTKKTFTENLHKNDLYKIFTEPIESFPDEETQNLAQRLETMIANMDQNAQPELMPLVFKKEGRYYTIHTGMHYKKQDHEFEVKDAQPNDIAVKDTADIEEKNIVHYLPDDLKQLLLDEKVVVISHASKELLEKIAEDFFFKKIDTFFQEKTLQIEREAKERMTLEKEMLDRI